MWFILEHDAIASWNIKLALAIKGQFLPLYTHCIFLQITIVHNGFLEPPFKEIWVSSNLCLTKEEQFLKSKENIIHSVPQKTEMPGIALGFLFSSISLQNSSSSVSGQKTGYLEKAGK